MEETLGSYVLHFDAQQVPEGGWHAYVTIDKFDQAAGDFVRLIEKQRIGAAEFSSYGQAMEAARVAGNGMVETWRRERSDRHA